MTAIERKNRTESLLRELNIFLKDVLPPLEEEAAITLRSPQAIATRIVMLAHLSCFAQEETLRDEIVSFLKATGVWASASHQERKFFAKTTLAEEDKTAIFWRAESIWLLLWVLNRVDTLGLPTEEVDMQAMLSLLPPFMQHPDDFVQSASTRPVSEILDQADLIFRLQWAASQAYMDSAKEDFKFNAGILYERYHALNWVIRTEEEWP